MSAVVNQDPTKSASKKKKKSKKKANSKAADKTPSEPVNGSKNDTEDEEDDEEDSTQSPRKGSIANVQREDSLHMPSSPPEPASPIAQQQSPVRNGSQQPLEASADPADEEDVPAAREAPRDATARLDALQAERDNLRSEVTQLRQELESIQAKHEEDVSGVREELEQTQQDKEHAEDQYRNLLGKVNTIRSQLGERLKQDAADLEEARGRIEELEQSDNAAKEENEQLQQQISELSSKLDGQGSEIEQLRSRTNLSTSNWAKERDDLLSREAYVREEYEVAKQAMQDWEILATEERRRREMLEERFAELEDQLTGQREAYERARGEADTQGSTVDGLQRALREVQQERQRELRELVEQSQAQLEELRKQQKAAEDSATDLRSQLETTRKDLDRALPFEKEVKEKSLQIGKLRHEAVILNDHLTKALRFLKRGKPEDNVDRQLVTNHFLHFLALDRSDPKKFQILQLIAALLAWDEQQKEQAGLLRAGTGTLGTLRVPSSPFRRTPSTPTLGSDTFASLDPPAGGASRESLAELWSDFLEREAEAGGASSRRGSVASSSLRGMRSPSLTSGTGITSPIGRSSPELKRKESEPQGPKGEKPGAGT